MRFALALAALLAWSATAFAAGGWLASLVKKPDVPAEIVKQTMAPAPSNIPDMLTAVGSKQGGIIRAWYSQPTGRYAHGALGDKTEGGALVAERTDGSSFTYRLGEIEVFEDLYPRIADLDGDGKAEIVTIRSSMVAGASVAVFGFNGDALVEKASTPFLGQPFRWLNIAGIGRFLGGQGQQIAFVATPHTGGKLAFLDYRNGRLSLIAASTGFSNHVFGSTELRLSAMADFNGDGRTDLALPSADRKRLRLMALTSSGPKEIGHADLPGAIDKAIAVKGSGHDAVITVGLEDGKVYEVRYQQ